MKKMYCRVEGSGSPILLLVRKERSASTTSSNITPIEVSPEIEASFPHAAGSYVKTGKLASGIVGILRDISYLGGIAFL